MFKTQPYSLAVSTEATGRSNLLIIRTLFVVVSILISQLWIQSADAQTSQQYTCDNITAIPAESCQALQDLYHLGAHSRWFSSTNPCEWPDITCEGNRITELELDTLKNMTALPESVGNLTQLTDLSMLFNPSLVSIDPVGRLQNLQNLYLAYNDKLSSLPNSIGQLQKLETLMLQGNEAIVSLPNELGDLKSLREIKFWGSFDKRVKLTIPESVGYLPNLELIEIQAISVILPSSIGQLPKLRQFSLTSLYDYNNSHCHIPDSFTQLTSLELFSIQGSSSCTRLPNNFGNLSSLKTLVLSGTSIVELPHDIGRLYNLETLGISDNFLLTHLPDSIGNLSKLRHLAIGDSQYAKYGEWFRGNNALKSIPHTIGNLHQLESLSILGNGNLTAVPAEIGQLSNLKALRIVANGLSSVPSSLARSSFPQITLYDIDVPVGQNTPENPPIDPPTEGGTPCPTSGVWPAGCDPNLPTSPNTPMVPEGQPCPASGVWPAGCDPNLPTSPNTPTPPAWGQPCPTSGVWPAGCIPGGSPSTPTNPNGCVIPASGPWPDCATAGDPPPPTTSTNCIIPPSGPWPPCARGGY